MKPRYKSLWHPFFWWDSIRMVGSYNSVSSSVCTFWVWMANTQLSANNSENAGNSQIAPYQARNEGMVELGRLELPTSSMPLKRSPRWATAPQCDGGVLYMLFIAKSGVLWAQSSSHARWYHHFLRLVPKWYQLTIIPAERCGCFMTLECYQFR